MLLPCAAQPRLCPGPEHTQTLLWVHPWGPLGSGVPPNRTWSLKSASGWHLSGSCLPALGTTMDFRLTLGGGAVWQDSYSLCVPQDRDWSVAPGQARPCFGSHSSRDGVGVPVCMLRGPPLGWEFFLRRQRPDRGRAGSCNTG